MPIFLQYRRFINHAVNYAQAIGIKKFCPRCHPCLEAVFVEVFIERFLRSIKVAKMFQIQIDLYHIVQYVAPTDFSVFFVLANVAAI